MLSNFRLNYAVNILYIQWVRFFNMVRLCTLINLKKCYPLGEYVLNVAENEYTLYDAV